MEFSPNNPIVRLCIQGMTLEEKNMPEEAGKIFLQAWSEATSDFEKFLAAHFVAKSENNISEKLNWCEAALQYAMKTNDDSVKSAFPALYENIAKCHERSGNHESARKYRELAAAFANTIFDKGPFYHGTRADLKTGDLLTPGFNSNYNAAMVMNHIYFTALPNGAGLAAALAKGEGHERVYVVEPTGIFENDPNVTDKKFPGNLTRSYRTVEPLKIVGEVTDWKRQTPEQLQAWKVKLANNKGEIIN